MTKRTRQLSTELEQTLDIAVPEKEPIATAAQVTDEVPAAEEAPTKPATIEPAIEPPAELPPVSGETAQAENTNKGVTEEPATEGLTGETPAPPVVKETKTSAKVPPAPQRNTDAPEVDLASFAGQPNPDAFEVRPTNQAPSGLVTAQKIGRHFPF